MKSKEGAESLLHLREMFTAKDGKPLTNLAVALVLGILLLVGGGTFFRTMPKTEAPAQEQAYTQPDYEERLEARLAEILAEVAGAGRVKAMVTLSFGAELVIAEDTSYDRSVSREDDGEGGSRETETLKTAGTKIMIKAGDGTVEPLVVKEIKPKVEGVIIVADGGGDAKVKEAIISAVQTVLGVEPHKVQVLKAKTK